LLSDNGPGFISDAFAQWLAQHGIQHVRGAPAHPQTQGKIERWHQTMKNRILLENHYLPGALQAEIEAFVEQYNHRRYHESLRVRPGTFLFLTELSEHEANGCQPQEC
jgi:transposase InsO family protein